MQESDEASAAQRFTVPAEASMVATLRARVAQVARRGGADAGVIDDLELAVSELATNVVQHAGATEVSVTVRHEPGRWILEIDGTDDLDSVDTVLPAPDALSGRGLFIVQAVMDEVEIVDDDGRRYLRCSRRSC